MLPFFIPMELEPHINPSSLVRLLRKGFPGAYYDLNGSPALDPKHLSAIHQEFFKLCEPNDRSDSILFVGVAVFILDLNSFRGMRSLSRGLRNPLARMFGIEGSGVSHKLRFARDLFEVDRNFQRKVLSLAKEIKAITCIDDPNEAVSWFYSLCPKCSHFNRETLVCSAYPEGIPSDFLRAKREHRGWEEGQVGVTSFSENN